MAMTNKRLGVTPCPDCGVVAVTDPNKFVLFMPRGLSSPYAEVTCEQCGLVYKVRMTWESAYVFDSYNCPVVGFSPARGGMFNEEDLDEFVRNFDEYHDEFLSIIDSENEGQDEE